MIKLPIVQATALSIVFEEQFDPNEIYFEFIEMDEILDVLIGNEINPHFYELLELCLKYDEFNIGFMVMIAEFLQRIEGEAVTIEFFELAHNCKKLKNYLYSILE